MHKDESAKEGHCRVLDPLERLIANYALTKCTAFLGENTGLFPLSSSTWSRIRNGRQRVTRPEHVLLLSILPRRLSTDGEWGTDPLCPVCHVFEHATRLAFAEGYWPGHERQRDDRRRPIPLFNNRALREAAEACQVADQVAHNARVSTARHNNSSKVLRAAMHAAACRRRAIHDPEVAREAKNCAREMQRQYAQATRVFAHVATSGGFAAAVTGEGRPPSCREPLPSKAMHLDKLSLLFDLKPGCREPFLATLKAENAVTRTAKPNHLSIWKHTQVTSELTISHGPQNRGVLDGFGKPIRYRQVLVSFKAHLLRPQYAPRLRGALARIVAPYVDPQSILLSKVDIAYDMEHPPLSVMVHAWRTKSCRVQWGRAGSKQWPACNIWLGGTKRDRHLLAYCKKSECAERAFYRSSNSSQPLPPKYRQVTRNIYEHVLDDPALYLRVPSHIRGWDCALRLEARCRLKLPLRPGVVEQLVRKNPFEDVQIVSLAVIQNPLHMWLLVYARLVGMSTVLREVTQRFSREGAEQIKQMYGYYADQMAKVIMPPAETFRREERYIDELVARVLEPLSRKVKTDEALRCPHLRGASPPAGDPTCF